MFYEPQCNVWHYTRLWLRHYFGYADAVANRVNMENVSLAYTVYTLGKHFPWYDDLQGMHTSHGPAFGLTRTTYTLNDCPVSSFWWPQAAHVNDT